MKLAALTLSASLFALAQTQTFPSDFDIVADHQVKTGSVLHLSGHVTVKTSKYFIEANTMEFNQDTHGITAGGNVVVTVDAGEFDLQADHQVIAGAIVHLLGHVVVKTGGLLIESDAVDFAGDANRVTSNGDVHILLK